MQRLRSLTKLLLPFSLVCLGSLLYGQTDRATIEGIVTDPSGAVISDAKVSIVKVDTNDRTELRETGYG
jgi:hypothetical protein